MKRTKMNEREIETALQELPGWKVVDGKLQKTFKFDSFAQAMGWMMSVAVVADKMDHHPEWFNVYSSVHVDLVTHDLGDAISNLDIDLARKMNSFTGEG